MFETVLNGYKLEISLDGYAVTDENWRQNEMHSPYSRLYYVIDGEGVFLYRGKEIKIEPGYAYFAPTGVPYGFHGTPSVKKLFFHINVIKPDGYDLFSSPDMRITRIKYGIDEIRRLVELYRSEDPIRLLLLKAQIWGTVMEFATKSLIYETRTSQYSKTILSAITYIRENLSAGLTQKQVADALFSSVSSLSERFKREMGTSVATYIEDLVMFEACKMLAADGKTIGEISAALGYCDQFYFSRRFTRRFSVTPREYRRRCAES